jgi:Protein of unknown function (DUF1583) C domain
VLMAGSTRTRFLVVGTLGSATLGLVVLTFYSMWPGWDEAKLVWWRHVHLKSEVQQVFGRSKGGEHLFDEPLDSAMLGTSGLLVAIPPRKGSTDLPTRYRFKGDFEVTASFELQSLQPAAAGDGVGAYVYVTTPSSDGFYLARKQTGAASSVYVASVSSGGRNDWKSFPTTATSGRFQIRRRGATVWLLIADGASDQFRELRRVELDSKAFHMNEECRVILSAINWRQGPAEADVVWKDFTIRAETLSKVDPPAMAAASGP